MAEKMSDEKSTQLKGTEAAPVPPTTGPEPWLRGTHTETPAVLRAVVHALELAQEDLRRWCGNLSDDEVNARPHGLPPIAFHLRHMGRSADRLLTYAEGRELNANQLLALKAEMDPGATRDGLLEEVTQALENAMHRVQAIRGGGLEAPRTVGRKQLPTTVAGLVVHVADHTQRHVGQAVTTAKILLAQRG
ncbi:MAG TPA: DinB family protein [Acidisarcina sp.]|nr:DinB family protein [Acidisarcina sp.]